ncbi:hypothetical protein EN829_020455 [Mesorhizobium sp. M00.F.Ca.ET.186.01.1.1]|nr:hypothetical protein EN848_28900 [bacterium M00.F.Ca.ET.205.01.1.1]TGU50393.1 hypothetical protein EN795_22500 [bacterium M00.F.Ca.ET.152.01.1.1]TGV33868.1 hypothetical protein EN829_020455 [Mesorhizobium sp. M00.F.Ca.ET.186.01.1.1]TGZ40757.1 hypothetical protein EN805_21895 [bacterium M00.F.Ca.ET.162.01.1.1]
MNIHKNARLTPLRREEMARDVVEGRLPKADAARTYEVTASWSRDGWSASESRDTGMLDHSLRSKTSPRQTQAAMADVIMAPPAAS